MTRDVLIAVIDRIYADLRYRRRFERWSEGALIDYIDADLTGDEWRLLVKLPADWLPYHSVQECPHCGNLAVVSKDAELIHCPNCLPVSEYISEQQCQAS